MEVATLKNSVPAVPCICCGTSPKAGKKAPRGWKRHNSATYCDKCWGEKFTLRAITVPVVRPLGEGVGWKDLRKVLAEAWADSTACANWMTGEHYAKDVRRGSEDEKMPAMPKVYLYPDAVKRFPNMPTQAVASMEQVTGRKYRAKRYHIVWTSAETNSNHRYPYPAAFPSQAWTPSYEPAGKDGGDLIPCVSVPIRRGQRFLLQLRGGAEFARQLRDFKLLVSGQASKSEIALFRKRVGGNENRNGVSGRDSGGQNTEFRLMCKMVGWFPRTPRGETSGILSVKSTVDSMLVAVNEKEEKIWWLNSDHVRRWYAGHKRRLQRWSEDQKHELRPNPPLQSIREQVCINLRNRIDSFIKETVAQLCGVAVRRRLAEIRYDDSDQRYLPVFQWFALQERLATKCNELGIKYIYLNAKVKKPRVNSASETELSEGLE